MGQRVLISGASGLIGRALSTHLLARGDEVVHLVRRAPRNSAEIRWVPGEEPLDPSVFEGVDALVHLAGAGIGDRRWTAKYKALIRRSRIEGTRTLAQALVNVAAPVRFVSGSAVGFYGDDRGEETLTEGSAPGSGFLAEVVRAWEVQTEPAARTRHPVALARSGIVMSRTGGTMGRILPLAKLGLFGPLGTGQQFWAWITLVDEVRALTWLIDHPGVTGPVNLVAPTPARQREFAQKLGSALGRPALLTAPAPAIRLALGGLSEGVLGSQRAIPTVLLSEGFSFEHPDLEAAMPWLVGAAPE
ncbi:MAG TPA: TIGR01777 family oxidoreductase [Dermatophilaceae bacterium]|nr:TIGR01777 family oxidoreductase [Dermatophilaceae bacterium]